MPAPVSIEGEFSSAERLLALKSIYFEFLIRIGEMMPILPKDKIENRNTYKL
jgi:hypothetical protein